MLSVFIPILEIIHNKTPNYYKVLMKFIPVHWSKPFTEYENAINQIKIYSFIANNCKSIIVDQTNRDSLTFIDHLCETIKYFLRDRFPVHLKKEVLNLVGFIYNLPT